VLILVVNDNVEEDDYKFLYSWIAFLTEIAGIKSFIERGWFVRGHVPLYPTQSSMAERSKRWPYFVRTGSTITYYVIGHKNDSIFISVSSYVTG